MAIFAMLIALTVILQRVTPTAFIPTEDKGYFATIVQLPHGASLQRTMRAVERVESILKSEPSVHDIVAMGGRDLLSRTNQTNSASIYVNLKPWNERPAGESVDAVVQRLNKSLSKMRS